MSTRLNREQGDLLHRQLFLSLREQIRRGVYPEGSAIPPEDQLGQMFGVSRITVRRAVSDLVDAGLLEKRLGRGTFVRTHGAAQPGRPSLTVVESMMQRSRQTQVKVMEVALRLPPPDVAAALELAADQQALFVSRLRSAGELPLVVVDTWVVQQHAKHLTAERLRRQSMAEILVADGVRFGGMRQEIAAVGADPHVAGLLRVAIASPLLKVVRCMSDQDKRPVWQLSAWMTSERSTIRFELDGDQLDAPGEGKLTHKVPG